MATLAGSFSGVVTAMDETAATVRIEQAIMWDASVEPGVKAGDDVQVLRSDFMPNMMPQPGMDRYVEGKIEQDSETQENQYLHLVAPV